MNDEVLAMKNPITHNGKGLVMAEDLLTSPATAKPNVCCVIFVEVHKYFLDVLFSPLQTLSFLFCLPQFSAKRYLSKNGCY